VFDALRDFPAGVRALVASAPADRLRTRGKDETFAPIEQVWHLADLEVEGWGERIRRILDEENPHLPDFRGDVIAEERHYRVLELEPALQRFEEARAANLALLETVSDWERSGDQEGVGHVTLRRVVEMMEEHDRGHAAELRELLAGSR
jgi:hypothetical protein